MRVSALSVAVGRSRRPLVAERLGAELGGEKFLFGWMVVVLCSS
jgi:hypothetical protein